MIITVKLCNRIMPAIERRRVHASISYDTPLNNSNRTICDELRALLFKNLVESDEYKLLLKTLSDCKCFDISESEFQQSIDM
jgi:hypothetical protein